MQTQIQNPDPDPGPDSDPDLKKQITEAKRNHDLFLRRPLILKRGTSKEQQGTNKKQQGTNKG